jgi:hypothetical protein
LGRIGAESLHQRRFSHPGNAAEQGAFAARACGRVDGGSQFFEFGLSVDHATVEVKQWSGHGAGRTVTCAVVKPAR